MDNKIQRLPDLTTQDFWGSNLRAKPLLEFRSLLKLKEKRLLGKRQRQAKGGLIPPPARLKKSIKAKRKQERKYRELQIAMIVQHELESAGQANNPETMITWKGGLSKHDLSVAMKKWEHFLKK